MRPPKRAQSAQRTPLNRIFGTAANVRLLRALSLESSPMNRTELGRVAGLEAKGAHLSANRLLAEGVLERVGKGSRQQVQLNPAHPLAAEIRRLFQAEQSLAEGLLEALREAVHEQAPELIGAWIQGSLARGEDRPGEPIQVGLLAGSRGLGGVRHRLRERISRVEQRFDVTVELLGYTKPDLAVARPAERKQLASVIPLFGLPPYADGDFPSKGRAEVTHDEREREQLFLARFVADRLLRDPAQREAARAFIIGRMRNASRREKHALEEWLEVLETMSGARLTRFLLDEGERATRLRQTLPFLDMLSRKEREELLARARTA